MTPHPESPNPDAIPAVSESGSPEAEVLFGRYRVERELGRGGMGRVLLAFDTKLRIYVAVKLVPEQLMADAESAEDLRREVLRGIALTHPAIVRTHTFEQDATGAGIVMEYIDGLTFTEWKEQQPNRCFEPEQLFPWLGPLCEVLDYAHREARIVHRDLKPRNLMISQDGKLKVADFGIAATLTDTHSRVTGQSGTSGTRVFEQYDKVLATNQNALTQRQRLDEALQLQQRRDALKQEWLAAAPVKTPEKRENLAAATKDQPFVNSLGMKFVPVPGTDILLCIHETRRKDYAAYAEATPGVDATWKSPSGVVDGKPLNQNEEHPVVQASWNDATAFCEWLSKKEGRTYRLPSEHEWNLSVVTGLQDPRALSAAALANLLAQQYPWESNRDEAGIKHGNYDGNADGFEGTAPVMSFLPNALGLYDLGGNAWEWCNGWFDSSQDQRVLRGCGYRNLGGYRKSHNRQKTPADFRVAALNDSARRIPGFRCALVIPARPPNAPAATVPSAPAPPMASPTASPAPSATPVRSNPSAVRPDLALAKATKDAPFTNSLGMKFVPVPGTKVLFCVHETRRQDYAAYATRMPTVDGSWKNVNLFGIPCGHEDNHPVLQVSWEDAQAFCVWLSKQEGKTYRLPTDEEWSFAAGVARNENRLKGTTPGMLTWKGPKEYPWGNRWPPPKEAGNYADAAYHEAFPQETRFLADYSDGFATTAPVMRFKPNKFGLHDLGGNVLEWVEDWLQADQKARATRGSSFTTSSDGIIDMSWRGGRPPTFRQNDMGFRCVVELPER